MQSAVIEYARNILNLKDANSTEMDPETPHPVIDLMQDQKEVTEKGGTMRLGAYDCHLENNSNIHKAYKKDKISERHRHRFELNNIYKEKLESAGLIATGINKKNNLVAVSYTHLTLPTICSV